MRKLLIILSSFVVLLSQSCENEGIDPEDQLISLFGSTESHNAGKACISCHVSGGDGEGWFNLAGTVYDSLLSKPYPNAIVKLYTESQGKGLLAYSLQVDALGNFYSTENIEFGNGLYVSVEGSQSNKYMQTIITGGDCNSCHGVSTVRIWVK